MRSHVARFTVAALLVSSVAHADLSDAERRSSARTLFFEGVSLQDKGNFGEALRKFEGAEKLFNAPTHLLHIAECQAMLGKLLESAETYRTLAREVLPNGSPDAFSQAQKQGAAELPGVEARIPTLKIVVTPAPAQLRNLTVLVNGSALPPELVGVARPVNPGSYKVSAYANGYAQAQPEEATVKERDASTVNVTLRASTQGGAAPAVVIVDANGASTAPPPSASTTPATTTTPAPAPPPYKPTAVPPSAPGATSTGLLLGIHGGGYFPAGLADGSGGPGIGIDGALRFARFLQLGLRLEGSNHGKETSTVNLTSVSTSVTSGYGGLFAALTSSATKTAFYAELSVGSRTYSATSTALGNSVSASDSGAVFGTRLGIWIPAGNWRILPAVGGDTGKIGKDTVSTYYLGLSLRYSIDFGKPDSQ